MCRLGLARNGCAAHRATARPKTKDLLLIAVTRQFAGVPKCMQMAQGFTEGKADLMGVQRSAKHHRNNVHRAAIGLLTSPAYFVEPLGVVISQLFDSGVQSFKGLAMRWQHQGFGLAAPKSGNALDKPLHRIRLRLNFPHRGVG